MSENEEWLAAFDRALKPSLSVEWEGEELRLYRVSSFLYGIWPRRIGGQMRFFVAVDGNNCVERPGWMDAGLEACLNQWLASEPLGG